MNTKNQSLSSSLRSRCEFGNARKRNFQLFRKHYTCLFLFLLFVVCGGQVQAQNSTLSGSMDARELETFLEPIFNERMSTLKIPGAVFVFVKDGQIVFSKGYGFADIEANKPVVADRTLFQIGSISKLFTATAVMQLAEQNKLDLHQDVNRYLTRFRIEERFGQPVTLHHLLTHTGGFEDRFVGVFAGSVQEQESLADHLSRRMPSRVMPPGRVASYSNHGISLAGHIVEQASGLTFDQYVTENILQPLQMKNTASLLTNAGDTLSENLAVAYDFRDEKYQPVPRTYYGQIAPAASVLATGTDMAHFMIAHLQRGRFGDGRILDEQTAAEMHRQQFTHHPKFPGWAYGFFEDYKNGKRLLMHGGGARGYVALLTLLPDENTGFFIACNAPSAGLQDAVSEQLLNRFYPGESIVSTLDASEDSSDVSELVGSYRYVRLSRTTLEKILRVFEQIDVSSPESGKLSIKKPGAEGVGLTQIEPLLYRTDDGENLVSFRKDEHGRITHLFLDEAVAPAFEKLRWFETIQAQTVFVILFALVFFSAALVFGIVPLIQKILRKRKSPPQPKFLIVKSVIAVASFMNLVFLFGFPILFFSNWTGGIPAFFTGLSVVIRALLVLPIITTIAAFVIAYFAVVVWKKNYWSFSGRLFYSIVALVNLGFIPFLIYWNLLGFKY
jgi:CubicO group peptidase (beta-lactamase class C family)